MYNLHIGIDVGNTYCYLFALAETGEIVLNAKRIGTFDDTTWHRILKELASKFYCRACFEIGPNYEWLYDLLREYCLEVEVVNAADFAVISRSQKKTDKIDSSKLAKGMMRGDLPTVYVPDKETRADRRLVSQIHWHSQQLSSLKGRIRAMLTPFRLRCPYSDILGRAGKEWLLNEASSKMDENDRRFLKMLVEQGELLVEQRKELNAQVSKQAKRYEDVKIIESIPGCGQLTALALLSSISDISRFETPGELAGYFGVCGSVAQSGKSWKLGPMTKRGNGHVRWLLSQNLKHLHAKDPKAKRRYLRLKRGKPVGVARGAQMRWLTNIIWHLLKKKETYQIDKQSDQVTA